MATIAEIGTALQTLNQVSKPGGLEFELGRNIDGSWFLSRGGDASVFLGATKADALRALEAFTDGIRIGMLQAHPVAVP